MLFIISLFQFFINLGTLKLFFTAPSKMSLMVGIFKVTSSVKKKLYTPVGLKTPEFEDQEARPNAFVLIICLHCIHGANLSSITSLLNLGLHYGFMFTEAVKIINNQKQFPSDLILFLDLLISQRCCL